MRTYTTLQTVLVAFALFAATTTTLLTAVEASPLAAAASGPSWGTAGANTLPVVTNNRCGYPRSVRMTGVNGVELMSARPIAAGAAFTSYLARDQSSIALYYRNKDGSKYDEFELTMVDQHTWYDISLIDSYTGEAMHVVPIYASASGAWTTSNCHTIGCGANASPATCPNVYWTPKNAEPADFNCGYNEIVALHVNLCG